MLGEGTFGKCVKRVYRGQDVAVKYFKNYSTAENVSLEAMMINSFDHPGMF